MTTALRKVVKCTFESLFNIVRRSILNSNVFGLLMISVIYIGLIICSFVILKTNKTHSKKRKEEDSDK